MIAEDRATHYARELREKGFTEEAIINFMRSRNFSDKEIKKAVKRSSKPRREEVHLMKWLIICLFVGLLLVPVLVILTKDNNTNLEPTQEQNNNINQQQENKNPPTQSQIYQCVIDQECRFDEQCIAGVCQKLICQICEEAFEHQCRVLPCDDGLSCTLDACEANQCLHTEITTCIDNDGCCPAQCSAETDLDCQLEPLPTLNQSAPCESDLDCFDGNTTTVDKCNLQTFTCSHIIPTCTNNDGICPVGCSFTEDNDCNAVCGNNVVESTEKCDGDCPTDQSACNDQNACTLDSLLGSASLCTAECVNTVITTCSNNDGCCPSACTYATDNDCQPNGTIIKLGTFTAVFRTTGGNLNITSFENGERSLTFSETFYLTDTTTHPELQVYLATPQVVTTGNELSSGSYSLGPLQSANGGQSYTIPTVINIETYGSIVIYSSLYNAVYAYATLTGV